MTYEDALAILRDGWPITPEDFAQIAADIWDQGYHSGTDDESHNARGIGHHDYATNPYRNERA